MEMALTGELKDFSISNIVQINCVEKNSSQVTIENRKGQAVIFFDGGEIVHACFNELKGEQALYQILSLNEGQFKVFKETNIPDRTINTPWHSLLLEGMRVMDESFRDEASVLGRLGEKLKHVYGIIDLSLHSCSGEQILPQKDENRERDYAAARLIGEKAEELVNQMHLGEMQFIGITLDKTKVFVSRVHDLFAVITAKRDFDNSYAHAIIDSLNDTFKKSDNSHEINL